MHISTYLCCQAEDHNNHPVARVVPQPDALELIKQPEELTPRSIMIYGAGCSSKYCSCPRGVFNLKEGDSILDANCTECGHEGSIHNRNTTCKCLYFQLGSQPLINFIRLASNDANTQIVAPLVGGPVTTNSIVHLQQGQSNEDILDWVVPRHDLVQRMIARMFKYRIILVRGTPACGKSILAKMVSRYLALHYTEFTVALIERGWRGEGLTSQECQESLAREVGMSFQELMSSKRVIILLDEAQMTYGNEWFWSSFLKSIVDFTGPYVIMFASYGSAKGKIVDNPSFTPPFFGPGQRIGLRWQCTDSDEPAGLLFNKLECEELIRRRLRNEASSFSFDTHLTQSIIQMTSGHAGALAAVTTCIIESADLRIIMRSKSEATISVDTFERVFFDEPSGTKLLDTLRNKVFSRGLLDKEQLENKYLRVILHELVTRESLSLSDIREVFQAMIDMEKYLEALRNCCSNGWIQKEERAGVEYYVFPSPIHRWNIQQYLLPPLQAHQCQYSSPREISLAAVKLMNPSKLRLQAHDVQDPSSLDPMEDHFLIEFMRCADKCLYGAWLMIPQYGDKGAAGSGAIDLFVSGLQWGFEIMRNGNRRQERYNRFLPGGAYYRWIQNKSMLSWIVLDFRTKKPRGQFPGLFSNLLMKVERAD